MSLRLNNLQQLLHKQYAPAEESFTSKSLHQLALKQTKSDIQSAYEALGGIDRPENIAVPPFSLQFKKFCIVFDEVMGFNRYRAAVLRSGLYERIPGFPLTQYKVYCRTRESECMKSAKSPPHWTSREAERHFGQAMDPGDLGLNGAPGWKFRAMQSLLLDARALDHSIRVVYLSVWDELMIGNRLVRLGDLLLKVNGSTEYFLKFFQRKLIQTYGD